jgi:hypothetical protein
MQINLIIGRGHHVALSTINDSATGGILRMGYIKGRKARDIAKTAVELLDNSAPFIPTMTTDN